MEFFRNHELYKRNKTQWSLSLLLVASPWILVYVTTTLLAHHSVVSSVPCWSDELAYWHEVLSFSQKGFNFGYYSMNEALPRCLSFGTHGFGTVSVYALFAKVFGWKACSLVIANAFFMSMAFLIFTLLVKISSGKLFFICLLTLTYIPLILFSGTSMSELLNFSVLIVYFSLLHVYFQRGGKSWLFFLFVFCTAIAFIRIINVILFIPLLFKRKNEFRPDGKFILSIVIWVVFSGLLFLVNNLFVSPYPGSFLSDLFKSNGFPDFVRNFVTHFGENAWNFMNPASDTVIQVVQRYFEIVVCLVCLRRSNLFQPKSKKIELKYLVIFLILFLFILVNLSAYDVFDWRDYRVVAPVLYGSILFLILNDNRSIVYGSYVFNAVGIVLLLCLPQILESFHNERYIKHDINPLLNMLEYTVHPATRFENTIIVQQFNTNTVLNIPAGIGISFSDVLSDRLKSRYIYSTDKIQLLTYKLIDSNEHGYLYEKISTVYRP